jgi:hypothetical protein
MDARVHAQRTGSSCSGFSTRARLYVVDEWRPSLARHSRSSCTPVSDMVARHDNHRRAHRRFRWGIEPEVALA